MVVLNNIKYTSLTSTEVSKQCILNELEWMHLMMHSANKFHFRMPKDWNDARLRHSWDPSRRRGCLHCFILNSILHSRVANNPRISVTIAHVWFLSVFEWLTKKQAFLYPPYFLSTMRILSRWIIYYEQWTYFNSYWSLLLLHAMDHPIKPVAVSFHETHLLKTVFNLTINTSTNTDILLQIIL